MRRSILVALGLAAVAATSAATAVAVGQPTTITSSPELRASRFYQRGPGTVCDGDACGVGTVAPLLIRLPAGTYRGVISVSLTSRTVGSGDFYASVSLRDAKTHTSVGAVAPHLRPLAFGTQWRSTTVEMVAADVPGDRDLELLVGATVGPRSEKAAIYTQNYLVQLRVSPES